ncbi:GMC family oxidoreductase [Telluria mixta]|uniref:GMC family oxidoreductase n=1 Tax=Telluria mixta TaxID=34071 RepID=A0ABT2C1K3_9BURK|nr:GMC family oxidoreductase [Telluria mixta]MCS0631206.1 GMC family oxidoreductase [Telluria mixta]WEM95745.1 GMC family oxidoreductase [Telluria mixta]
MTYEFDAIVIGSGITGGMAAKELTQRGMKVLVLERGRPLEHQKGYKTEFVTPWDAPNRGTLDRDEMARDYPIQSRQPFGQFKWDNKHYWVKDSEQPYVQAKPYAWLRANVLGGRSLLWGRQVYRWSDLDFEANRRDGHGNDWPIRYADLAPWYSRIEKYIGASGENLGLAHFPDMELLPPMEMTAAEKHLRARIQARWPERYVTIGRTVNLTKEHNGRGPCNYRNICQRGCSFGAYFSSLSATLPDAQKTGLLTVKTDAVVHRIVTDPKTGRARGVEVIDAMTKKRTTYTSRIVFLNAGAEASVQILLQSADARHPNGLGNQGDVLGRYICDHDAASVFGVLPGLTDRYYYGRRANGIYIPRFRNLRGVREEGVEFDRGYVLQGGSARLGWADMAGDGDDFGADFKKRLATPGPWMVYLAGVFESLPRRENRITLDPQARDRYGLPQLRFDVARGDNENRIAEDIVREGTAMLQAAGVQDVQKMRIGSLPGLMIHVQGGARMGNDPSQSVLNAHNQVHGVPNVFVTDGAMMASGGSVNPSLTFMALTARAVEFAVDQIKAGAL